MELPLVRDYRRLFLEDVPLLDVRAPVEFRDGAFPCAENHPLLNDQERESVGIRYKEQGPDDAVALGHALVRGEVRAQRIAAWRAFAERHPEGALYCFRGGMRSQISQQWLFEETGIRYPRIQGGYKALRRFLIDQLEAATREIQPLVLGGRTGVGKTLLLRELDETIDLERLAWHRGSAFGPHATPQPAQIDFENALSIALLKQRHRGRRELVFEDESRTIGAKSIPAVLFDRLKASPLWILEASLEERIQNTLQEYVTEALQEYQALHGAAQGFERWSAYLLESLDRIQRRLGGARHQALRQALKQAIEHQQSTGEIAAHRAWIQALLVEYYDPMYDYQIGRSQARIQFRGDAQAIREALARRGRHTGIRNAEPVGH
jgi:tRNA 2-selenouridine synthase